MAIWEQVKAKSLRQGDLLRGITIPVVPVTFPEPIENSDATAMGAIVVDVIVLSQSCDLENRKITNAVVGRVISLADFEKTTPTYKQKSQWKQVWQGRVEAIHLLPTPEKTPDDRDFFVVDFREISSLPLNYVEKFAEGVGNRWRLNPPFAEALSQSFGRFFMRVALPHAGPTF